MVVKKAITILGDEKMTRVISTDSNGSYKVNLSAKDDKKHSLAFLDRHLAFQMKQCLSWYSLFVDPAAKG